ncbi:potassium channel family protein [Nesterenkonia muleiensis]|uniref:potassium channel family protein n=1 Tax=Nesterenkonia muleiensis TaxID=2282648 RepID=UPI000E729697|nr:TrkA family potassium uptake protein [Nesterenkonia muleiensis]
MLVIGLGRFGIALAQQLVDQGQEVLAVDRQRSLAQKHAEAFTHTVEADATDIEALRQLGATEFDAAVVGVGTSIESSVLIAANLVDLGVSQVWAKAINPTHGKILTRIGCHHVIYPEHDAGVRAAHLVSGKMMDFIKFDDDFAIVKMYPPKVLQGKTIEESQPRKRHHVNVVGVKPPGQDFVYAQPETRIRPGDTIVVSGDVRHLEWFADHV